MLVVSANGCLALALRYGAMSDELFQLKTSGSAKRVILPVLPGACRRCGVISKPGDYQRLCDNERRDARSRSYRAQSNSLAYCAASISTSPAMLSIAAG